MVQFGRLVFCLLCTLICASADFFTSMEDLQKLLQIEKDIPKVIDSYIVSENARLDELRGFV